MIVLLIRMRVPHATVVVVSHNAREELRRCLESLPGCSVVVFDNHSSDGSVAMALSAFPGVEVMESETNLGYGAAANRAIQFCSSEYIVLSNSDVILAPDTIRLRCLDRRSRR